MRYLAYSGTCSADTPAERGISVDSYDELWQWSVTEVEAFCDAVAEYFGVTFHDRPETTLVERIMPAAQWFPQCDAELRRARAATRRGT